MGKNSKGKELGKGISQRKDGRYQARYIDRFGKRKTIYSTNIKKLREELKEKKKENNLNLSITKEMTLNEWFDIWIHTFKNNCRETSKRNYLDTYRHLDRTIGNYKLTELNLMVMQDAFNKMPSDNARRQCKIILKDMLNVAKKSNLIAENSAEEIKTQFGVKTEKRVLTKEETVALLEETEGTWHYELFVLALETGMRGGELTGLRWENVDLDKPCIYVRNTLVHYQRIDGDKHYIYELHPPKTKSGIRTIPLTKTAISALQRQKEKLQERVNRGFVYTKGYEDFVFLSMNLAPLYYALYNLPVRKAAKRIGIEGVTFHSFRHTFATRAIECGMNPKTLQKILGHSKLSVTMDLYCHTSEETLYHEMEMLDTSDTKDLETQRYEALAEQEMQKIESTAKKG